MEEVVEVLLTQLGYFPHLYYLTHYLFKLVEEVRVVLAEVRVLTVQMVVQVNYHMFQYHHLLQQVLY